MSDCNERKSLITNLPISLETGASGESVELHISVSEHVQVYGCNGFVLTAEVTLDFVTSHLSTHSLSGIWDQKNGGKTFKKGTYCWLTRCTFI